MKFFSSAAAGLLSLSFVVASASCGGATDADIGPGDRDSGTTSPDAGPETDVPFVPASKVDLLLVVDNSASMGDKAKVLASSLKGLVSAVARTNDVHLGVISTSLGSMGGDVCPNDSERNGRAHLRTTGPGGTQVATAARGFLSFGGGAGAIADVDTFAKDAEQLVLGVGENGCGLEAQLESAYRFLVQPDPWTAVTIDPMNQADLGRDVDVQLLQQRADFLRPDSLVIVLVLTDEDDSNVDPLSVGGQGWAFAATQFPGSTVFRADGRTTTAPRGTSVCKTNPASADCTSCGFGLSCDPSTAACQAIKNDPECQKNGGYYGPTEDPLNVRFHRMKERYGIDPQYPISRYVTGFSSSRVPDRSTEHVVTSSGGRRVVGPYEGTPSCTNPLFAAQLPRAPGDELCKLPRGPRSRELVVFAVLGGVPTNLVSGSTPSWNAILGANPDAFDYSGIDPHMIPSTSPRASLPPPSTTRGDNGPDPIHGREWDTGNEDLQYACTFDLPEARTCTLQDPSCDCAGSKNPPLCGQAAGQQVRAKAYPTLRPLRVAQALGDRGVVGSICPSRTDQGYEATLTALTARLTSRITQ